MIRVLTGCLIYPMAHEKSWWVCFIASPGYSMPEVMGHAVMSAGLTLDAIACKEEDAVVVDYILKGERSHHHTSCPPPDSILILSLPHSLSLFLYMSFVSARAFCLFVFCFVFTVHAFVWLIAYVSWCSMCACECLHVSCDRCIRRLFRLPKAVLNRAKCWKSNLQSSRKFHGIGQYISNVFVNRSPGTIKYISDIWTKGYKVPWYCIWVSNVFTNKLWINWACWLNPDVCRKTIGFLWPW